MKIPSNVLDAIQKVAKECDLARMNGQRVVAPKKVRFSSIRKKAKAVACFLLFAIAVHAQSAPSPPVAAKDSVSCIGKTATVTTEKHTASGKSYHVFQGSRGGRFIIRKSAKSGSYYRQYLPKPAVAGTK